MAKITDLFLLPLEEEKDYEAESSSISEIDFDAETLDPAPYWSSSSVFEDETLVPLSPPIFSTDPHHYEAGDRVTLSFDLCPPQETLDTSDFGSLDCGVVDAMSTDYLGLRLGLGFDVQEPDPNHVEDRGDGLRIAGFDLDSESDSEEGDSNWQDQDPSLPPLCWDSLRLEEERSDFDVNFEWEEVDGRLDERDFLSMMVGERWSSEADEVEVEDPEEVVDVDWEVLLAVSNVVVEDGDYINPSDYEVLFEQVADHDSAIRGSPPAAKSVVANLPSLVLTQEDVGKNNAICAVCKDDISLKEKVRRLPCLHHYHGDCILPWLEMRNTCPVCRFELPTDDPVYESWKAQRRARNDGRYDFEMFIQDLV